MAIQQARGSSGEAWTIANTVTVVRICLIPVFMALMLADWATPLFGAGAAETIQPWTAMAVYALISLTDSLDGYLARSRGEVTVFGKFIDPIADKLLVVTALIALVEAGSVPSWIPIVIVARELLVSGLRMVVASKGVVVAASWIGKAKTFITLLAICMFIVKDTPVLGPAGPAFNLVAWTLMLVAVALTLWSMVDYFRKCRPAMAAGGGAGAEGTSGVEGGHPLAVEVVRLAVEKGVRIGCAESCTGGLVAGALTSVPGSSEVVCGGVASYMADVKTTVLGVDPKTIERSGVVSEQTASEMAAGAVRVLGADLCVSTTGVAGPGGGTAETPVGTVCFGVCGRLGAKACTERFEGGREQVRSQAVDHALSMLLEQLRS